MNKRYMMRMVLVVLLAFLGLLMFNWNDRWSDENPIVIEQAKAAIRQGRGYEVITEDSTFLTNDAEYAMLIFFIEGHYGYTFDGFVGTIATFVSDNGKVEFEMIKLQAFTDNYILWEKVD